MFISIIIKMNRNSIAIAPTYIIISNNPINSILNIINIPAEFTKTTTKNNNECIGLGRNKIKKLDASRFIKVIIEMLDVNMLFYLF
jgi:hypothetical protein